MDNCDLTTLTLQCQKVAKVLKTLSHPQRLALLCHLSEGSKTVGELHERSDLTQPHVSQFLNRMKDEGLVDSKKDGNFAYYFIKDEKVLHLLQGLQGIFCTEESLQETAREVAEMDPTTSNVI